MFWLTNWAGLPHWEKKLYALEAARLKKCPHLKTISAMKLHKAEDSQNKDNINNFDKLVVLQMQLAFDTGSCFILDSY